MTIRKASDVHLVLARNDDQLEQWATTAPKKEAAAFVQAHLAPGWTATLTRRRPTARQIIQLRIDGIRAQKLK
jgi:hypothetical protein